jgi:hypothetical protein
MYARQDLNVSRMDVAQPYSLDQSCLPDAGSVVLPSLHGICLLFMLM